MRMGISNKAGKTWLLLPRRLPTYKNAVSFTAHLLQRPLVHTSVASHAFTVAAPTVWNSLSVNTRSADSFASFKRRLKSELYASNYAT